MYVPVRRGEGKDITSNIFQPAFHELTERAYGISDMDRIVSTIQHRTHPHSPTQVTIANEGDEAN